MIRHRNPARSLILQWCNNHDETLKRLACHDYPLLRNHSLSLVFHCNRWKSFNCSFGSSTVNGTCVTNEQSAKWNDEQCKLTWNAAISKMLSAHSPFIATKQMNFIERQHQIVCHIVGVEHHSSVDDIQQLLKSAPSRTDIYIVLHK